MNKKIKDLHLSIVLCLIPLAISVLACSLLSQVNSSEVNNTPIGGVTPSSEDSENPIDTSIPNEANGQEISLGISTYQEFWENEMPEGWTSYFSSIWFQVDGVPLSALSIQGDGK